MRAADNLLGSALSLATAGGSDVALSLFDAKAEVIRLGQVVAGKVQEKVGGLGRYDRSRLLQAAHGVIVVTAFFEALDDELGLAGMDRPEFTRDDQVMLAAGARVDGDWLGRLLNATIPVPAPDRSYAGLLGDLQEWYASTAGRMAGHLAGLAVWDQTNDTVRNAVVERLRDRLPGASVTRYESAHRRLAVDIPEFSVWIDRQESQAVGRGLETIEALLLQIASSNAPGRHRDRLAKAFRADLVRPILGRGGAGDLVIPALGDAYIDPRFRVKAAGPNARPADEDWWDGEVRSDIALFLTKYLTTPQAADGPLLLLGQPGAGKSSLTKILAARLPAADFMVVRVALRDVSAEVEIQDQVEQALRQQIGETVAWAELAESAAGALPVILLDGFDELLQVTGIHQSDYLQRVAAFQQREASQDRPVAVMVTSRLAVADRARLPVGSLAVRLEPFDEPQLERWLDTWNAANTASGRPLTLAVVRRFPDLAGQPLLLLMLALYNATGEAIRPDDESFDNGQLYERLLSEFAEREVRRIFAGRPESAIPDLVEAELVRLSVVAFAMFHRVRLWATEQELDSDLQGLGLEPARRPGTEGFHAPLTAGQEMIGRFFFIQRAQAVQDGRSLQTYEFLHATFGEYLVARLVVHALKDAAARQAARILALPAARADDELIQSLLGFTPLTARNTVMPFITSLLAGSDHAGIREWLVVRLRVAMTRPEYSVRNYRPIDKRADHWMATYSFNLTLLTLACGESLRASEIFLYANDPAKWLSGAALQWRAAIPSNMWLGSVDLMSISDAWSGEKRDMVLAASSAEPLPEVEPRWSLGFANLRDDATQFRGFSYHFALGSALKSMPSQQRPQRGRHPSSRRADAAAAFPRMLDLRSPWPGRHRVCGAQPDNHVADIGAGPGPRRDRLGLHAGRGGRRRACLGAAGRADSRRDPRNRGGLQVTGERRAPIAGKPGPRPRPGHLFRSSIRRQGPSVASDRMRDPGRPERCRVGNPVRHVHVLRGLRDIRPRRQLPR
jgi:hypothetical protein